MHIFPLQTGSPAAARYVVPYGLGADQRETARRFTAG